MENGLTRDTGGCTYLNSTLNLQLIGHNAPENFVPMRWCQCYPLLEHFSERESFTHRWVNNPRGYDEQIESNRQTINNLPGSRLCNQQSLYTEHSLPPTSEKKKETSHTQTNQLKIQQKDKTKLIQTNKQTDHWRNQNYGIRKITFDTQLKIRVSTGSKSLLSFSSAVYTQRVLPRFARPKLQWHFDTQSAFDF